jgi:hypothetical protein
MGDIKKGIQVVYIARGHPQIDRRNFKSPQFPGKRKRRKSRTKMPALASASRIPQSEITTHPQSNHPLPNNDPRHRSRSTGAHASARDSL